MRVYDYLDAQEHAEMWMEDLSDEELEACGIQPNGNTSVCVWSWQFGGCCHRRVRC